MSDVEICPFPKHEGREWVDIIQDDRAYMEWLVSGEPDFELWDELETYLIDLLEEPR